VISSEASLVEFLVVTVVLGGAGAWLTGRAMASVWRPAWLAALAMLPLAAAVRFIHFALFQGPLLAADRYLLDLVILVAVALAGHRRTRARRMCETYPWLYRPAGPFGWRHREPPGRAGA
jgi:hypothetical protein